MIRHVILVLVVIASPTLAIADVSPVAKEHMAKAAEAHARGDLEEALGELETAYLLEQLPELLYAMGQVNVQRGRCDLAIGFYERYLDTKPVGRSRLDAKDAIATCRKRLASPPEPLAPQPVPEPTSQPAPVEPPNTDVVDEPSKGSPPHTEPIAPSREGQRPAWYRDRLGGGLVIGGVVAGIAAAYFYRAAVGELDAADDATSITSYRGHLDEADNHRTTAVVFGIAGAALISAGVVRYAIVHKRTRSSLAIVPNARGAFLTLTGAFE